MMRPITRLFDSILVYRIFLYDARTKWVQLLKLSLQKMTQKPIDSSHRIIFLYIFFEYNKNEFAFVIYDNGWSRHVQRKRIGSFWIRNHNRNIVHHYRKSLIDNLIGGQSLHCQFKAYVGFLVNLILSF